MASGTAASVKLCATGLQRPRVLTVKIELMSVFFGHNKISFRSDTDPASHPAQPDYVQALRSNPKRWHAPDHLR
jgi:hypothetical protein